MLRWTSPLAAAFVLALALPASAQESDDPDLDRDGAQQIAQASASGSGSGDDPGSGDSAAGQPDETEPEEKRDMRLPPRVPWRGTAFAIDNSFTTSMIGVGDDVQSRAHEVFTQTYSLALNYFFLDQKGFNLAISTGPSMSVELTDSNSTTTRREPWFNDLPVTLALRATLYSHDDEDVPLATGLVVPLRASFPTSPASQDNGTYLTTAPGVVLWQVLPLLPKSASPILNSVIIGGSARWEHRFGAATTAVNPNLQRTRQDFAGQTFFSDQLTGSALATNTLREGLFVFFVESFDNGMQASLFGSWNFTQQYLPTFGEGAECEVLLDTGCVNAEHAPDVETTQYSYGFGVGAGFAPTPELGLDVSYSAQTHQLGPDGTRRNVFYNPNAQFSVSLAISLDAIYEVITGPRRNSPFFLVAQSDKKNRRTDKHQGTRLTF